MPLEKTKTKKELDVCLALCRFVGLKPYDYLDDDPESGFNVDAYLDVAREIISIVEGKK